jgi:hypothetical protein
MIELFKDYGVAYIIGLLSGLLIITLVYAYYLIMKRLKNKRKEKEQMFYCEVEQWGKCREQCEICKKTQNG